MTTSRILSVGALNDINKNKLVDFYSRDYFYPLCHRCLATVTIRNVSVPSLKVYIRAFSDASIQE